MKAGENSATRADTTDPAFDDVVIDLREVDQGRRDGSGDGGSNGRGDNGHGRLAQGGKGALVLQLATDTRDLEAIEAEVAEAARQSTDETTEVTGSSDVAVVEPEETIEEQVRRRSRQAKVVVHPNPSPVYRLCKRALDLLIAVPALLLALPMIAIMCLIIRIESPGPAIFRQYRVGQGGKLIRFYKFRTMYSDAKERWPELYDYRFTEDELENLYYKNEVDPRNTRFGAWIRKTTLDELPNLFNVVIGNVSLVGPRPELEDMVKYYTPEQLAKFSVKSGITGLAASTGRNKLTVVEQITADVEYVANQSMLFDLRIIFRTAWKVVRGEGAE
ncbi:MAG: hypothetical protein JJLCMIEE_02686 [Acidimicrobiales bacterium]|nr:MAG: sugar transferase [Actinomycetota bacterium]MBV6509592.1 hypothetical protein [Acidimicrobiales bacterium]RIK06546.1 MAG: hypothetical protein DCC48_06435 [Acidobacteriota bacterium]